MGMAEPALPISGKVAEILDRYTLAINRGSDDGVQAGMIFAVMGSGGDIIDPETKKSLGPRPIEKLRVRVIDVYEKFSVAETYRIITPQSLSDYVRGLGFAPDSDLVHEMQAAVGIQQGPERERVAGAPDPKEAKPRSSRVNVQVGDTVREIGHMGQIAR